MEPTTPSYSSGDRPVRDIGHVRLIPERDTRSIWNGGLLGWVSLAVFGLMLFVVSEVAGMRHDLQEVVITQSNDVAQVKAEVRQLKISVRELTEKLEEKTHTP
jgi:hypothetical protein